jgi:hypothetical protein
MVARTAESQSVRELRLHDFATVGGGKTIFLLPLSTSPIAASDLHYGKAVVYR